MNKLLSLRKKAIKAAKKGDWDTAVSINKQIVDNDPEDTGAHIRMGVALAQLNKTKEAQKAFEQVLAIDSTNKLAQKHLDRLKNTKATRVPAFTKQHFIEEPGKTKTVELTRLTGKDRLQTIAVGDTCELKAKKRYISVEVSGDYVGALPEDLSYRLTKLMKSGNEYSCTVRSCSDTHCRVYLKEEKKTPENEDVHSFPTSKHAVAPVNDVDDHLLVDDEIPVEIVDTDADDETTIDDIDTQDLE